MDVSSRLIDFVSESAETKDAITALIDSNEEIFFLDLEVLKEHDCSLATLLQQQFSVHYEKIRESFRAHTLASYGRSLDISFVNPAVHLGLRGLRSAVLGTLLSFSGTATRSSQVRPELVRASFTCKDCKTQISDVKQEFVYSEPLFCSNHLCSNRSRYDLDMSGCEFANWQRVHIQENAPEIPRGSLPRSIDVIVRDGLVERIRPGSHIDLTGFCIAVPIGHSLASSRCASANNGIADERPRRRQHELSHTLIFVCVHFAETGFMRPVLPGQSNLCCAESPSVRPFHSPVLTMDQLSIIKRMQATPSLYETLSSSLFPSIHGHSSIKSAILLMLVGGVTKQRDIRLRGDINVLLVGDPGTAKSQFLKQTAAAFPCSVYTSGKSSSAAGLTAAVVKDTENGEFTIEAGALMLSDGGVCCIDEFDKMSYKDQVSIHEAMEQQTITIAKAGINATLNSRTSILAAANPVRGRYDPKKTLRQNVNLSPPIMSRFDLYFILIDEVNAESDRNIALKILDNHLKYNKMYHPGEASEGNLTSHSKDNSENINNAPNVISKNITLPGNIATSKNMIIGFTVDEVILYIEYVKQLQPVLSEEARELLIAKYTELRQDSLVNTTNYRLTARHLESMVRLSEALAKIHNDPVVGPAYVMEAYRLIKSSVVEVSGEDIDLVCKENEDSYVLKNKEYLKVTNALVYLLKSENVDAESLCMRYLEMIEESIENEAMLESEKEKCMRIIRFLIDNEGVLFEVDGILYIHPNYDN